MKLYLKCFLLSVVATVVLGLMSCADKLPSPMLKAHTNLNVKADWGGYNTGLLPSFYNLIIGEDQYTMGINDSKVLNLYSNNAYTVTGYTPCDSISISGDVATVRALGDGTIIGQPGKLFASSVVINTLTGESKDVVLPMKLRNKLVKLVFPISITGIQNASVQLSNIAASISLSSEQVLSSGTAISPCTIVTEGGTQLVEADLRIFGVDTADDKKNIVILTMNGNDGTMHQLQIDLTSQLANVLSNGDMTDVEMRSSVISDFGASVNGWTVISQGTIHF